MTETSTLFTPTQVAELLQIPASTLQQWRFRGIGPVFTKLGPRLVRYAKADLDAWLLASKVGS